MLGPKISAIVKIKQAVNVIICAFDFAQSKFECSMSVFPQNKTRILLSGFSSEVLQAVTSEFASDRTELALPTCLITALVICPIYY
jgi:hypothetical protein